jgi:alcohol dehydrogenase (NADP+)
MLPTKAYAALNEKTPLAPFEFDRRNVGDNDILIEILYCGVCHSDIHQARGEWGNSIYPMVPGHEIVGRVAKVGSKVSHHKVGDLAGVGCFVDSCRKCPSCSSGEEQYCQGHVSFTYNGTEQDMKTPTHGGYSSQIVVDQKYALKISPSLDLKAVAPLLCAGITTYSPLKHWKVGPKSRIAILGLGGLGHMGVKFGKAFGAHVTVISTSPSKQADAQRLGADAFLLSTDQEQVQKAANSFDLILDTVSAEHDLNSMLSMVKLDGSLVLVGVPPQAPTVHPFSLIPRRRSLAGSMIGGIRETQEMLDFCAEKGIVSDVEMIAIADINKAYERMIKNDVRYRFVIDMKTL